MSHVNHQRGETREFVYRRAPRKTWRKRGRKGLTKGYDSYGIQRWCPCCLPASWNRTKGKHRGLTRTQHRELRKQGLLQIQEAINEE